MDGEEDDGEPLNFDGVRDGRVVMIHKSNKNLVKSMNEHPTHYRKVLKRKIGG